MYRYWLKEKTLHLGGVNIFKTSISADNSANLFSKPETSMYSSTSIILLFSLNLNTS